MRFFATGTILLLVVLFLLLPAGPAAAQEPVTDDEVNEIARELYCPVCENTPLDVCPTQACEDWRAEIRAQLSQGKSKNEIHQYFVERYGAKVLATPPQEGFNLIAWILPIGAVVIGAIFFGRYLKGLQEEKDLDETADSAQSTAPTPPPAATEDKYLSQVEKEVREG
ncbi:MAG: cytochrome c-type biogenesis protein [Candidatus Promineifilaceae bacterium]|nr:cytochrome c-type biogenesis protein [Candidatus Promineifilaceae bacterium]